jgi:hypothetical protein
MNKFFMFATLALMDDFQQTLDKFSALPRSKRI